MLVLVLEVGCLGGQMESRIDFVTLGTGVRNSIVAMEHSYSIGNSPMKNWIVFAKLVDPEIGTALKEYEVVDWN